METNREKIERKCKACGKVFSIDMRSFYKWLRNNKGRELSDYACTDCARTKSKRKHGESKTRLFNRWKGLFSRTKHGKHYIERGIKVCPEWYDFAVFKRWAFKNGFKPDLQLDRIDNTKGYSPDNCQWITRTENVAKVWTDRDKATIKKYLEDNKSDAA
jgi:uncharacterized protein YlaI